MRKLIYSVCFVVLGFLIFLYTNNAFSNVSRGDMDACKSCHEDYYKSFINSIHGKKSISGSPINQEGCVVCHTNGAMHVEKGGGKGVEVFTFGKKVDSKEKSSKCLFCHKESKTTAFWDMSKHKSNGVACTDCHLIHSKAEKGLISKEKELCYSCHKDIKMQFNKQSHHPVNEGKMKCSSCHTPHGGFGPKMILADAINELCYNCHADKRGPFMYEHPPVEENCLNCHSVHGSNHNRMLSKKQPLLCQSCHDWSLHPGTPYTSFESFVGAATAGKNRQIGRGCMNCHSNIHGSNGPSTRGLRFVR